MRLLYFTAIVCALVGVAFPAYDTNTVGLISNLATCTSRTDSDIQCMTSVRDGLQKISDTIQDVRDVKTALTKVVAGINTLNVVLAIAKYAPGIGSAVTVLKNAIKVVKTPLETAKSRVTTLDNKIYPWKARIDPRIGNLDTAITYEGYINGNCTKGGSIVSTAKSCIDEMAPGHPIRTVGEGGMELVGDVLNPEFSTLNNAFGNIGRVCATVKRVTDIALSWPDLSALRNALASFTGVIDPIIDLFAKIQSVLDKELCIPDPLEKIKELEITEEAAEAVRAAAIAAERAKEAVAERARESAAVVAERARESAAAVARAAENTRENGLRVAERAREALPRIRFRGWGRKRRGTRSLTDSEAEKLQELLKKSLRDISISENKANTLITSDKKGDICLSVQKILDGINAAFNILLAPANALIDAVLNALPSFNLPGLPDLNILNFNIDFDLPSLDFGFDFNLYAKFDYLKFNCASGVLSICRAVGGNLNVDCGISLASYQATFGKRELADETSSVLLGLREVGGKTYVEVPENPNYVRKDDKNMTMEEAKDCIAHLSPEGRVEFLKKVKAMNLHLEDDADEDEKPKPTEKPKPSPEASEKLRMIAKMLSSSTK